jgi:hypothetical protein
MLNNISWQGYWTLIVLTAILYYVTLLFSFYKTELAQVIRRLPFRAIARTEQSRETKCAEKEISVSAAPEEGPPYLPAVHSLVDEMQSYFEALERGTATKETILASLKQIIKKYPGVKGTAYQHSVSNLIVFLAEQNGSLHLSTEEAGSVWL